MLVPPMLHPVHLLKPLMKMKSLTVKTSDDDQDDDWEFDFENMDDLNDYQEQLDTFMASAMTASKAKGIDPAHLSKIW